MKEVRLSTIIIIIIGSTALGGPWFRNNIFFTGWSY
jgi:hypothetical protein